MSKFLHGLLPPRDPSYQAHGPVQSHPLVVGASQPLPRAFTQPHGPRLDQTSEDCASRSNARAMRDKMALQGIVTPVRTPSSKWMHWWARWPDFVTQDVGVQLDVLLQQIVALGYCTEEHMPYTTDVFTPPSDDARRFAIDQVGKFRFHAAARTDEIKQAMFVAKLTCHVGAKIDQSFEDLHAGADRWNGPVGEIIGGHEFSIVGWDDDAGTFDILNQWGEGWGTEGMGRIPYEVMDDDSVMLGRWCVDWVPTPSEDIPSDLASKINNRRS